jgi:hypothetical protein
VVQGKGIAVHSMLVVSEVVVGWVVEVEVEVTAAEATAAKRDLKVEKTSPQTR